MILEYNYLFHMNTNVGECYKFIMLCINWTSHFDMRQYHYNMYVAYVCVL